MRGTIVHYNANDGHGLIAARDGRQYPFQIGLWRSGIAPKVNQAVALEADGLRVTAVSLVPAGVLLRERTQRLLARLGLVARPCGHGTGKPDE